MYAPYTNNVYIFYYFFSWRIRSNISTTIWYPIQFAVDSLDRRQEDNKNLKKCRFFPFVLDKYSRRT